MEKEKKEKIELSQEEVDRTKELEKIGLRNDYENKLKELDEFTFNIQNLDEELVRLDKDVELFTKLSDIIVANYSKDFDKCDFAWEKQQDYWNAKKEQEKLSIERKFVEFKITERKMSLQRQHVLDQIESLEASVKEIEAKEL